MNVYKAGKNDYRVRVRVAGKWRDVGTFSTRAQAEKYKRNREFAIGKRHAPKRVKAAARHRKNRARAALIRRMRRRGKKR